MNTKQTPGGVRADEARDAHLSAALRHAPDADQRPPGHLSARILAAAHRAAAEPRLWAQMPAQMPARAAPPRRRWWAPAGLGASGALASVLLAGVIGLLWNDGPPGPGIDEAPSNGSTPAPLAPPAAPPAPPAPEVTSAPAARSETVTAPPPPAPAAPRQGQGLAVPAQRAERGDSAPIGAALSAAPRAAMLVRASQAQPDLRWRVDGVDRGLAPASWVQTLRLMSQERGQPHVQPDPGLTQDAANPAPDLSPNSPLAGRQIELQETNGTLARIWLAERSLLWCSAGAGAPCLLSGLSQSESNALMQPLDGPPAAIPAAAPPWVSPPAARASWAATPPAKAPAGQPAGQPGQHDSK